MVAAPSSTSEGPPWLASRGRVTIVPVVHHAAASARAVETAIDALDPDVIAVQLPCDAAPHIDSLAAVRRLPVALYGFSPEHAEARAYAPLSATSPELAALRSGRRLELVDWPLEACSTDEDVLADTDGMRIDALVSRLGAAGPAELIERLHAGSRHLGAELLVRLFSERTPSTRERFMAGRLAAVRGDRVLALIGAAHAKIVSTLIEGAPVELAAPPTDWTVWCVPYDEGRLHDRGFVLFPRWQRRIGQVDPGDEAAVTIAAVGRASRKDRNTEPRSVADEIEALRATHQLARLRGSTRPTVRDVLDGVRLAMVGDGGGATDAWWELSSTGPYGPLGAELRKRCVGQARGAMPPGTGVVPLLADVRGLVEQLGLEKRSKTARGRQQELRLDVFRSPLDRARSQRLHQLDLLGVEGVQLRRDVIDEDGNVALLFERWRVRLSAEDEQTLIDLAPLGPTLEEASESALRQRLAAASLDLSGAVELLERAYRMGLMGGVDVAVRGITANLTARGSFMELTAALSRVLLLHASSGRGDVRLEALARHLADRAVAALGRCTGDPERRYRRRWVDGLQTLYLHALEHEELRVSYATALGRAAVRGPLLKGAAGVLRRELGVAAGEEVLELIAGECAAAGSHGERFSAFLTGALFAGKGLLTRAPAVLAALDGVFAGWPEQTFLAHLPDLRLAFTALAPADVARLSQELTAPRGDDTRVELSDRIDAELQRRLDALGVFPPEPPSPVTPIVVTPVLRESARALDRWRLILGESRTRWPDDPPPSVLDAHRNRLLDALYDRTPDRSSVDPGAAGELMRWMTACREAFPEGTVIRMQEHALEELGLRELLLDEQVLANTRPSIGIAKTLLALRDVIDPRVLEHVRRIIRAVAQDIRRRFENRLRPSLQGLARTRERSPLRIARNLDLARTVRDNLHTFDVETGRLGLERVAFSSRVRRRNAWRLILLVDQSGSMLDAQLDAAVLAGIFSAVPMLDTRLIAFNDQAYDLSPWAADPVELLLKRIPSGGTYIAGALRAAETMVTQPRRTLCVTVTDLFEGGPLDEMVATFARMKAAGVAHIVVTGLGGPVDHDSHVAGLLADRDIPVGSLEPHELGQWIARRLR